MTAQCESTDFIYPMLADVYYPIVEQGAYGNVKKRWVLDRSVACSFSSGTRKTKEDIQPEAAITIDNTLIGRVKTDITQNNRANLSSLTNILLVNIRDAQGNIIYNESSGPRAGKSTIYEIASFNPAVGPFGSVDYYKLVIKRSENQAADL